jgi:hypothetical protein
MLPMVLPAHPPVWGAHRNQHPGYDDGPHVARPEHSFPLTANVSTFKRYKVPHSPLASGSLVR